MSMSVVDAQQSVASEVRAMLARKRISVSEAARRLGWNQMAMHRRVVGKIPFNVGEIVAVADLLDTPVEEFFVATANVSKQERIRKTLSSYLPFDLRFLGRSRAIELAA